MAHSGAEERPAAETRVLPQVASEDFKTYSSVDGTSTAEGRLDEGHNSQQPASVECLCQSLHRRHTACWQAIIAISWLHNDVQ